MKKRNIFTLMLIGCLVFGLTACGENSENSGQVTGDSEVSIEDVVKVEDGQVKVDEEKLEEIIEEETSKVWSTRLDDSYKPAFDAHPVLKGKDVWGMEWEKLESTLGTPDDYDQNGRLVYFMKNKNGVESYLVVPRTTYYLPGEDGTVMKDENGNPKEFYKVGDLSTVTNKEDYWQTDNSVLVDYLLGNEDYVMSEEGYKKIVEMDHNYHSTGNEEIYEIGYEGYAELFGTPGFLYYVTNDYINVAWAYTDGERKGGVILSFENRKPEKCSSCGYIQ